MLTYSQRKGWLTDATSRVTGVGWAGQREGKNNPAMQNVPDIGPLPRGVYTIGAPYHNPNTGPYTMNLTPDPANEMFGRADFRMHGAAEKDPELSSEGCIIMPRPVREKVWAAGDHTLTVVE